MSTQTWFITGASSGLGAAIANAALRAGHRVAVTARDRSRLARLVKAGDMPQRLILGADSWAAIMAKLDAQRAEY